MQAAFTLGLALGLPFAACFQSSARANAVFAESCPGVRGVPTPTVEASACDRCHSWP